MKKAIRIMVAAAVLALSACTAEDGMTLVSPFTEVNPMDNDAAWVSARPAVISQPEITENLTEARSLWDRDSLYLRFDVKDKDLRAVVFEKDGAGVFKDDMCEFLLDPRMDRTDMWIEDDIIYHININGFCKDDRGTPEGKSDKYWDGKGRWSIRLNGTLNDSGDVDEGYAIFVALPWDEIGRKPEKGLEMGFNFANNSYDPDVRHLANWCKVKVMRTPSQFGTLRLSKSKKRISR